LAAIEAAMRAKDSGLRRNSTAVDTGPIEARFVSRHHDCDARRGDSEAR